MTQLSFAEELDCSPEVSPARTSRLRGKAKASKGNAQDCGQRCFALFESADPPFASLKTFLRSEIEARTGFSVTWKEQATPQGRSWSVLIHSARHTDESASGLWRTPDTGQGGPSGLLKQGLTHRANGQPITVRLLDQSQMWPTPATRDYHAQGATHNPKAHSSSLATVTQKGMWPTPTVQDGENIAGSSQEGRNSLPLNTEARLWPTPRANKLSPQSREDFTPNLPTRAIMWPSPRAAANGNRGTKVCPSAQAGEHGITMGEAANSFPHSLPPEMTSEAGLLLQVWTPPLCPVLNVRFVEWLMAYPIGWTDLREVIETPVSKR